MVVDSGLDAALERSIAAAGEMGALLRAVDWSTTTLGPLSGWPRSLKSLVCTVLEMPTPAIIFWGPDQTQIYNSGYAVIMGPRHPRYLGAPYRDCWPDTHPVIFPWMQKVLVNGEVIQVTNSNFNLTRHGFEEEAYFTFTFSPLRDDAGDIAGILQPVVEVTEAVLAERRRETLSALASRSATSEEARRDMSGALARNAKDLPFSLVYAWSEREQRLELTSRSGFETVEAERAAGVAMSPVAERAFRSSEAVHVDDVAALLGHRHVGPWPEPTRSAVVVPLRRSPTDVVRGAAVFGISPRLRFDAPYRQFLEAIARELAVNLEAEHARRAEDDLLGRERAAHREAALQKEHLHALLTQAPTPMVVLRGPELVIELANAYACRVWMRQPEQVIDRPLFEALPELRGQVFDHLLQQVLRTGEVVVGTETKAELNSAEGPSRDVYFNFVYAPLRGLSGATEGVLVLAFDVTEQVRAREQVEQLRAAAEAASQAKDEFLAILGHELRNPLAPILTSLQLMRLRGRDTLERERTVIERQATHLVRLVDDLLDVSRITRGKVELKRERVELGEVVARAIEIASPLLETRKQKLVVDVAPRGLTVDVDPVRVAQAIANLLNNAAKYTGDGGRITIAAARHDDLLELRVRDTGLGIDPDLLPLIFDMFVQARQQLDRSQGGLGLGLTIVRSLITLHGGTVEARSEGRGRGSEFILRLPAAVRESPTAPSAPEVTPPRAKSDAHSRHVLVVDDNVDAASMLAEFLSAVGHVTTIAHDGPSALRAVSELVPDLALIDIGLPAMDGYELAHRLREQPQLARLGLVAVTGYGLETDRQRSAAAGFDAHLVKPVDLAELEGIVRSLPRAAVRAS